jgi:hypothetical protein
LIKKKVNILPYCEPILHYWLQPSLPYHFIYGNEEARTRSCSDVKDFDGLLELLGHINSH